MCGILGIVSRDRVDAALVTALRDSMRRRGPDDAGQIGADGTWLAMRRLAVIDIAGGDQPKTSEDGAIAVVFNGEIYNYRQLRAELTAHGHRFSSQSDTEVLVHGYEEWGIDGLLERLDAMFAFALWDRRRCRIFLARDRFGEKPLYLGRGGGTTAFGSSLLAVAAALPETPQTNSEAMALFWALHFVPGTYTIFAGVDRVQPAEAYELDATSGETIRRWRWWRLAEEERMRSTDELADLVAESTSSRLIADVPVGVFLSGGIDSSLLTAFAARAVDGIHTFSIGFESAAHDESPYAATVAEAVGATHHSYVFRVDEFRDLIPLVVEAMDEPIGDQAMLPVYALAREAAQVVTVVLSGEGADELFGGYSYYEPFADGSRVSRLRRLLGHRARDDGLFLDEGRLRSGFPTVLPPDLRRRLTPAKRATGTRWLQELQEEAEAVADPFRRATLYDLRTWLSDDLLMKADKMTMAHSLESRAPYLAHRLAEAAFNLPTADKRSGDTSKVALREVAHRLLPGSISGRAKQGFVLPMDDWLRHDLHEDFLASIDACTDRSVDADVMRAAVIADREDPGRAIGGRGLYPMLVMVKWIEHARGRIAALRDGARAAAA